MRIEGTPRASRVSSPARLPVLVIGLLVLAAIGVGAAGAALWSAASGHPPGGASTSAAAPPAAPSAAPSASTEPADRTEPTASASSATASSSTDPRTPADIAAGLLSLDVPTSAGGKLVVVPGDVPAPGKGTVRTVRVEVEAGLPVDGEVFAKFVMATLNDPRSWGAGGKMTFARTDGEAAIRVVLASPSKVDEMCAPLDTEGEVSCGRNGHAAINFKRWVVGTADFTDNLLTYRQYVVNHEVGHLLGHPHEKCPAAGALAPIMQQQTYGVAPCVANAWPHP